MKNLYDKIVNLLGQRADSVDYQDLVSVVGEPVDLAHDTHIFLPEADVSVRGFHVFRTAGFALRSDTPSSIFWYANFRLSRMPLSIGEYDYQFPYGIERADGRAMVQQKIGQPCFRSYNDAFFTSGNDFWIDNYCVEPFLFGFLFAADSDKLKSLTVMQMRLEDVQETMNAPFAEVVDLFLRRNEVRRSLMDNGLN